MRGASFVTREWEPDSYMNVNCGCAIDPLTDTLIGTPAAANGRPDAAARCANAGEGVTETDNARVLFRNGRRSVM